MQVQTLPVIRLKPKANARAIRHGFPWAYDNEVVTDRRTRALPPGTIAVLQDDQRNDLGLVAVNPQSRIMARMLDRDTSAVIDAGWLRGRLERALGMRRQLYDRPFFRLAHAEGDGLPGLVVDLYGNAVAFQPNAAWADDRAGPIADILADLTGAEVVVMNGTGRARAAEGLDDRVEVLRGTVAGPVPVAMNGATYMADLLGGQKTGLFYDQRDNHAFAARLAGADARVLDVFAHVGGFGLAALAAGAGRVLAVDSSEPALALAEQGAAASGCADRFATRKGDAFDVMADLGQADQCFDLVICDPPAFAPSKKALAAGLRAYERIAKLAAHLVAPGGFLGLCSCSHAADLPAFRLACQRGIGRAGRQAQLIHTGIAGPDHPQLPQLAESGYLKALFYRLD